MPAVFPSNHPESPRSPALQGGEDVNPLKHGGKHVIENLQILTATENMKKGARLPRPAITQESEDA